MGVLLLLCQHSGTQPAVADPQNLEFFRVEQAERPTHAGVGPGNPMPRCNDLAAAQLLCQNTCQFSKTCQC
jgi:hypothetical protein